MNPPLPPDVSFHPGPSLMVYRPRGVLNEDRIQQIIEILDQHEATADKPFDRFTDLSKLDALDLDFKTMIRISLHRRLTYSHYPAAKSAFYVTSPAAARVVKTHVLLTDHSPLQTKMFEKLEDAAKWLGVSRETLE